MTNWLVGATATGSFTMGREWDASLARIAEALEEASDSDRVTLLGIELDFEFVRAQPRAEDVDAYRRLAGSVSDPDAAAVVIAIDAYEAWLRGDLRTASETFLRASVSASQQVGKLRFWSARLAHWCGDAELVHRATAAMTQDRSAGRMANGPRLAARAMVDAAEGRHDAALEGFRAAIDTARDAHADFLAAGIILDARIALPDEPAIVPLLDEARTVFERVGARLYLDRLEAELQGGTSAPLRGGSEAPGPGARAGTLSPAVDMG